MFSYRFRSLHGGTTTLDLGELYYGARCAIHHQDPYLPSTVLKTFHADGGTFPTDMVGTRVAPIVIGVNVYPPTTLFLIVPFALLPYSAAQTLWTLLTVVLLSLAGYLIWTVADLSGQVLAGWLVAIVLANCEQMFMAGNVAGIAVSLCVIATWCFLNERYIPVAVVLFAVSLAIKPHDVGFVWLFFCLMNGNTRKRALQTLVVTAVIGLAAALWVTPVSPHWLHELHHNNLIVSEPGSTSDPSPAGITSQSVPSIVDLQATLSVFMSDPGSYNLASFLIVGPLLAVWIWVVFRRRMTSDAAWLAMAAIAALSLLPVYHRPYDAKLLLLAIPACAILWPEGGATRWISTGLMAAGILLTSDLPRALLVCLARKPLAPPLPTDKTIALSLFPPPVLLAIGCFFLWMLIRRTSLEEVRAKTGCPNELTAVSSASG